MTLKINNMKIMSNVVKF